MQLLNLDTADLPANALRSVSGSKGPKRTRLMDHSHQRPVHTLRSSNAVQAAGTTAAGTLSSTGGIRRHRHRFFA